MPLTLLCQDAGSWPESHHAKAAALTVYGASRIPGTARYVDGNQHDYGDLTDEVIHRIFGDVASEPDSIGVFLDLDPRVINGIYVYSITRLAASVGERFPQLVANFAGHAAIVDAIDAGLITVGQDDYSTARLVGNVVNVARSPVGGRPVLWILW